MTPLALVAALALAAPPEKPPTTLDEKIAAALKSHPDVKAAEAKRLLAEAEVEQARLVITQKVTAAVTKLELAKAKMVLAEEDVKIAERIMKLGQAVAETEKVQAAKAFPALTLAKAELAAAELELQQLVGKPAPAETKPLGPTDTPKAEVPGTKMPSGPAVEKLEAAAQKMVTLELKSVQLSDALPGLLKAAGVEDVPVRGLKAATRTFSVTPKTELTFGAALELVMDEYNLANPGDTYEVYVREYGLLVEKPGGVAPKDAPTLTQFVRAVRAKKK